MWILALCPESTLVVLKDQHEFILGEVLTFPRTNFGPFQGDLKERERLASILGLALGQGRKGAQV